MPSALDLFDSEACCSHDDDDDDDRSDEDDLSSSESMKQFIVDDSSSIFSSSSETTKKNTNRRILSDTEAEDYEYEAWWKPNKAHSEIQEQFSILRHQQESSKVKNSSTNDKKPLLFDIFTSETKGSEQTKQKN